ncbi:uncharacterized protein LOC111340223 [Stylophora pistillata]|uniref:uncharacterized protein LOC111340223 n=1 Tax=Stylophora pistillata TaxID=50429 RepID=UPI000C03BCAD|nr:uncharacterized protein LOC111340223 [Stylophora pistillata]
MSATQSEFEDSGEMSDCELKFLQSLFGVLHEHQKVLPALPEMCKRLITAQTNMPKEPHDNGNFDLFREYEKDILAKRKYGDLVNLKDQLAEKEERIAILKDEMKKEKESLEKMLSDKDKHFNRMYEHCKTQEQNHRLSNDKYIAELRAKEEELKQYRERIARLEGSLNSKESMLTTTR